MSDELIREEVVRRLAATDVKLPTSTLGRSARAVVGLGRASRLSLGRAVKRRFGKKAAEAAHDKTPEAAVAGSFGRLKGASMKMGQVLGYVDVGLPHDLRAALSALHTQSQPLSFERLRAVVEADLGARGRLLTAAMHASPLAAASLGQVHRSTLPDGTRVVVKILYPGVAGTIERDFRGAAFGSRFASWLYPSARSFVREVRERVLEECDYALEARRQTRFAALFADHPTIVVPAVHADFSSPRVLTTTFVEGLHLDAYLTWRRDAATKERVATALVDFYLGALFEHGLYHCDPHPGNYLFTGDGRVALIDFGCAREFAPSFVGRLASLTRALIADDRDAIYHALSAFGLAGEDKAYHHESTRWLLRALYGSLLRDQVGPFELGGEVRLREVLRRGWRSRKLAVPGELLFLLRTVVGLSSVVARLDVRANWHQRLLMWLEAKPRKTGPSPTEQAEVSTVAPSEPEVSRGPRGSARSGQIEAPDAPSHRRERAPDPQTAGEGGQLVEPKERVEIGELELVLLDAGDNPITLMRELRELTGLELREIKYLLDSTPQALRPSLPRLDAERWRDRLVEAGARIELRPATR